MTMPADPHDPLLDALLDSPELGALRDRATPLMLAAARARRHRQRTLQGTALVLGLAAMLGVSIALWHDSNVGGALQARGPAAADSPVRNDAATIQRPPAADRVPLISDEELFALFPDRPLALIGPAGHQRLVVLDRTEKTALNASPAVHGLVPVSIGE